jgi:hypothetical protein
VANWRRRFSTPAQPDCFHLISGSSTRVSWFPEIMRVEKFLSVDEISYADEFAIMIILLFHTKVLLFYLIAKSSGVQILTSNKKYHF